MVINVFGSFKGKKKDSKVATKLIDGTRILFKSKVLYM